MIQKTVGNQFLATGIPGEFSKSSNQRAIGAIINSASEANNVPGRVVKFINANDYDVGVAANGNFAGILSTPKAAIRPTLDHQALISNGTQIEVAQSGYLFVTLPAAAAKGDFVYYSDTDGTLKTQTPGPAAPAGHSRVPGGIVARNNTGAGIGEISFDINGDAAKTVAS